MFFVPTAVQQESLNIAVIVSHQHFFTMVTIIEFLFISSNMNIYKSSNFSSVEHYNISLFNFHPRIFNTYVSHILQNGFIFVSTLFYWAWGCRAPKYEGRRRGEPKQMNWYNSETVRCEAFTYLGAGGNLNILQCAADFTSLLSFLCRSLRSETPDQVLCSVISLLFHLDSSLKQCFGYLFFFKYRARYSCT